MRDYNADSDEQVELMNKAIKRKWNRFTFIGLIIIAVGAVMIVIGLLVSYVYNKGAYSYAGLTVGLGIIGIFAGIMSLLIGVINPLTPDDLHIHEVTLDDALEADSKE